MDGLIIKKEWLDLILSGKKTLEIRGCDTKKIEQKIYLLGYDSFYDYLLPRLKKEIEVCWIYTDSISNLADLDNRQILHYIFEYLDRDFVKYIGIMNRDNQIVFENAGYKCEYINYSQEFFKYKYEESNSIGLLGNDFDPNNNFFNQLAALRLVEYEKNCVITRRFKELDDEGHYRLEKFREEIK